METTFRPYNRPRWVSMFRFLFVVFVAGLTRNTSSPEIRDLALFLHFERLGTIRKTRTLESVYKAEHRSKSSSALSGADSKVFLKPSVAVTVYRCLVTQAFIVFVFACHFGWLSKRNPQATPHQSASVRVGGFLLFLSRHNIGGVGAGPEGTCNVGQ